MKDYNSSSHKAQEKNTLTAMLRIYCYAHHGESKQLCTGCQSLQAYAGTRLDRCPHGERKPACSQCTIHCYSPQMREQIRQVMRYAGPRLLWQHPVWAFKHLLLTLKRPAKK